MFSWDFFLSPVLNCLFAHLIVEHSLQQFLSQGTRGIDFETFECLECILPAYLIDGYKFLVVDCFPSNLKDLSHFYFYCLESEVILIHDTLYVTGFISLSQQAF